MSISQKVQSLAYSAYSSLLFPPLIVLIAILAITTWTWQSTRQAIKRESLATINSKIDSNDRAIQKRFDDYANLLIGSAAFYNSSDTVLNQEWNNYISAFKQSNYEGLRSLGFALHATDDNKNQLASDVSVRDGTEVSVYPEGDRGTYAFVIHAYSFVETMPTRLGFDMMSEAKRRAAIIEARDTGKPIMTDTVQLISEANQKPQPSFLIYMPVYRQGAPTGTVDERRAAIVGYTFASLKSEQLFSKLSFTTDNPATEIRAYNGSIRPDNLIYSSRGFNRLSSANGSDIQTNTINIFGQEWSIRYAYDSGAGVQDSQRDTPLLVVIAGASLAILLSFIVHMLLKARAHELSMQKEADIALARDELLSLASHQLRTPATTVKQYLGMVLQGFSGELTDSQKTLLTKAYTGNERQLFVINEMLHLAKIDSGRIQLAKRTVDIVKLVREIITDQDTELRAAHHKLEIKLAKKPLRVTIDDHMLRMAIENIINNAIKYTPDGGTITITVKQREEEVHISIADTGVGIKREDMPKLFKQFTRISNERSDVVGGTGIGLYLAHHLVVLHNGSIMVDSEPGAGTTFTIILPLIHQQPPAISSKKPKSG